MHFRSVDYTAKSLVSHMSGVAYRPKSISPTPAPQTSARMNPTWKVLMQLQYRQIVENGKRRRTWRPA
jgi:hypothetical protein